MNHEIIALSGMRGSGKSTTGRILAEKLGWQFIDLDEYIEQKAQKKVSVIVNDEGWHAFREQEKNALREVVGMKNIVLALGGGTIIDDENNNMLKNSFIIFLSCPLETCAARIKDDTNRPPITENESFIGELEAVWNERKEKYLARNDLIIESGSNYDTKQELEEKIEQILLQIHKNK